MAKRDLVVIGGSAGSGQVLKQIVKDLPRDFPATVLVSTHIPASGPHYLADVLTTANTLPVAVALDGQPLERSRIYLAAPDRHLLVVDSTVRLGTGPRENLSRPAIDPLFRSAALAYGSRAVGVVLTGMLNDGASGLSAIKARGGTAVVQHPLDAEADEMPIAALEAVEADHVAPASELGSLLDRVVRTDAGPESQASDALELEVEIASGGRIGSEKLVEIADPLPLTCPDCQGVLSVVRDATPLRFRCQIGHAQTAEVLAQHTEGVDAAIRIAMRIMEERVTLVSRMAQDARDTGRTAVAELYEARAEEYRHYASTLREAAITTMRARGSGSPPD